MAGIAGFIKLPSDQTDLLALDQMLACLKRAPSDSVETCARIELGAAAGWTAADEFGPTGGWNGSKDIALVFSGELFSEGSDVQDRVGYVLGRYQELGRGCLNELNGWFNGVLLDLRKSEIILFNDRYGLGRLYCHLAKGGLFFSSEAKSLLSFLPRCRALDPRGLGEWLTCGCALQNRTLFPGIELLPPGAAWRFTRDGGLSKDRYFDPATWESLPALNQEEYYERLKRAFPRILDPYLKGRRSVAMSLTGGLDGRMIMSWARRGPGDLHCYTFNGPVRDCADVRIAREVARVCHQPHQTIQLDDSFFDQYPALAEQAVFISDGAMDVSGAAELYVNRLARRIAPVRLTGNYGSEILRCHVAFRPRDLPPALYSPGCLDQARQAARTYAAEAAGNRLSFIAFKQAPWHHFARLAVEQSQLAMRSPFLDNELVALAFQAPPESARSLETSLRLIAEGNPALGAIPTDRGITYPANRLANGFRRRVQEFLAKAEYACDYGMPDWLARFDSSLSPLRLERLFLGLQKFCHFRSWYRDQLSGYVRQVLLDPLSRQRSYLNPGALEPMVRGHLNGTANYTLEIHKLLSLELLQRELLDGTRPSSPAEARKPLEGIELPLSQRAGASVISRKRVIQTAFCPKEVRAI